MTRNLLIFLGTFVAGALIALVVRAASFKPPAGHAGHSAGGDYAPMVSNASAPAETKSAADSHAGHSVVGQPVNTVCAICGMAVDPKLPTLEYQGKTIGFGCKMCPPKFKADPDRYGPLYLRNETVQR